MKKIVISILVVGLTVMGIGGSVLAYGGHGMRQSAEFDRYSGTGYQSVELTETQIDKISELREDFYAQSEDLREQLRDLRWEARDLYLKGESNAEIGSIEDEIYVIVDDLTQMREEYQQKVEALLTDEQIDIIENNRNNFAPYFGQRFNDKFSGRFNQDYGPGMMGRGFRPGFDSRYGHGPGMMGRGFDGGYGMGSGWCY